MHLERKPLGIGFSDKTTGRDSQLTGAGAGAGGGVRERMSAT